MNSGNLLSAGWQKVEFSGKMHYGCTIGSIVERGLLSLVPWGLAMPLSLKELASEKLLKPLTRPTPGFERDEQGRRVLVTILAPMPPSWLLIPLCPHAICAVNGTRATLPVQITANDVLRLGYKEFRVLEASSVEVPTESCLAPDVCDLIVRFRGREVAHRTVNSTLVIGTDSMCGLCLPPETGLNPYHAALLFQDHRWHLFALGDTGVTRVGDAEPVYHLPLFQDESVWLGDVELTVRYEELDPLDLVYPGMTPSPSAPPVTPDTEELALETEAEPGSESSVPSANTPAAHWRMTAVAAQRDNTMHLRGLGLCQWIQQEHLRQPPLARPPRVQAKAFARSVTMIHGKPEEIERFAEKLRANSWDVETLFGLADYLRRLGLSDSARWILKELYRQNPTDPVVAESLGMLAWDQSTDPLRSDENRHTDLKRAYKYITLAFRIRPNNRQLLEWQRAIGSELTLREMARTSSGLRRTEED